MKSFKDFLNKQNLINEAVDVQAREKGHNLSFYGTNQKAFYEIISYLIDEEDTSRKTYKKMIKKLFPTQYTPREVVFEVGVARIFFEDKKNIPEIYKDKTEFKKLVEKIKEVHTSYLKELGLFENVKVKINDTVNDRFYERINGYEAYIGVAFDVRFDMNFKNINYSFNF